MRDKKKLILYTRDYCGYCSRVKQIIDQLNVLIEERNIWENPEWEAELFAVRNQSTVPVLRTIDVDGISEWIPESREIIHYLTTQYSDC